MKHNMLHLEQKEKDQEYTLKPETQVLSEVKIIKSNTEDKADKPTTIDEWDHWYPDPS